MKWLFSKTTDIAENEYQEIYNSLTESRKNHIDRMKNSDDRKRSLAAQYLLIKLLGEMGVESAVLESDNNSKPYLNGSDLFVSISHSHEMVACAVDSVPIGIDIEKITPVSNSLIDYVCTDKEKEYVCKSTQKPSFKRFFEVWTAKEAYIKKMGCGLKKAKETDTLPLNKKIFIIEDYIITIL